jgi:hypothetical protein
MAPFTSMIGKVAHSTQTQHEHIIGSEAKHRRIKPPWQNDKILCETIHTQAGFFILACVFHLDVRMAHRELEILADVWVVDHFIHVLYNLTITSHTV